MSDIKSMKLYTHVERIDNELTKPGKRPGGPAHYLAYRGDIRMTALGLQADQHELAAQLTSRCGIDSPVNHVRVQGEATVAALNDFYNAVELNFQSGKLGGLRLCAKRVE